MAKSLPLLSCVLFHILACIFAQNTVVEFNVSKSCSCSEPFANFTVEYQSLTISDIVTTIDGQSDFVKVDDIPDPPRNSLIVLRWTSIMSVNKTCCWSIDNVVITREEESVNVTLCYDGTVYQYENKTWICSEPNSEFGSGFKSGEYSLTNGINLVSQCTNSIEQPSSGLPCSNSMTPSSTIPQSYTDMTSDSSSSIPLTSTSTVSPMTSDSSSSIQLTSTSTVSTTTSDSSSSIQLTSTSTVSPTTSDTSSSNQLTFTSTVSTTTSDSSNSISLTSTSTVSPTTSDTSSSISSSSSSVILAPSSDVVLTCQEDGPWIQTLAGTNATIQIGECFKGTVNGLLEN